MLVPRWIPVIASVLGSVVVSMVAWGLTSGEETGATSTQFTPPFPIVMVPTTASDEHRRLADDVAKLIGVARVQESVANPVCCIWLEITRYTPNPGDAGFWIINQPGGSIISASNIDQLRAAVDRFKKSARQHDGRTEVPVGLLTSYPVVDEITR